MITMSVTKLEDVASALRTEEGIADPYDALPASIRERIPTVLLVTTTPAMATADHPVHTRQRALFQRSLTPRRLAAHRAWIVDLATDLANSLAARSVHDVLEHFTLPLAYGSILGLFGAPLEH